MVIYLVNSGLELEDHTQIPHIVCDTEAKMFIYLCCVQWMGGGEVGSRDHDCQNVLLCVMSKIFGGMNEFGS